MSEIEDALKSGKWIEKKNKDGKVYYQNKGDSRTKEKTMWATAFKKWLKDNPIGDDGGGKESAAKPAAKGGKQTKPEKTTTSDSDPIQLALKSGKWIEKKNKDGKVYYQNKGDDRTKEKTMWEPAFKKWLKDNPFDNAAATDGKKPSKPSSKASKPTKPSSEAPTEGEEEEQEEEEEILDIDGSPFPADYEDPEGDEEATDTEKKMRHRLRAAYSKGWQANKKAAAYVDPLTQRPRPVVTAPVIPQEDWAPVEWPKWQSLLMDSGNIPNHTIPLANPIHGRLGLSPTQRVEALYGRSPISPPSPYGSSRRISPPRSRHYTHSHSPYEQSRW
eukprot:TRINITY_DN2588_c0_g1_i2.p1 TRINITY_DN2588_c0_g1~~TRINITY_DN2588_c0_g1_i2.p1  ORF type:complete len:331 (+),score=61.19 TRINITY_DN2588_c0_g1_i2:49-1041(+)